MPFFDVRISKEISKEKKAELAGKLEKSITLFKGKKPEGVQLEIRDGCCMWFGGNEVDTAYIDLKIYGHYETEIYETVTEKLFNYLKDVAGIDSNNVYITYTELEHWGVNKQWKTPIMPTDIPNAVYPDE